MAINLKTRKLPDCALIGVCAVIGSNTVLEPQHHKTYNTRVKREDSDQPAHQHILIRVFADRMNLL